MLATSHYVSGFAEAICAERSFSSALTAIAGTLTVAFDAGRKSRRTVFLLDEILEWTNRKMTQNPNSSRPA
ncbi:MAG: hypothetical protein AABO41_21610 [Acidobacteriota bacterium]